MLKFGVTFSILGEYILKEYIFIVGLENIENELYAFCLEKNEFIYYGRHFPL